LWLISVTQTLLPLGFSQRPGQERDLGGQVEARRLGGIALRVPPRPGRAVHHVPWNQVADQRIDLDLLF
jgi:hypothetical protein